MKNSLSNLLNKTDMSRLRSKQARSSKGVSEHQHFSKQGTQGDEPKVEYNMEKSPMKKDTGEVVSKTSPGEGWTKTKGTNIWAPPKGKMGRMMKESKKLAKKQGFKDSVKKSNLSAVTSAAIKTITNKKSMKPPYKKPVGPRAN